MDNPEWLSFLKVIGLTVVGFLLLLGIVIYWNRLPNQTEPQRINYLTGKKATKKWRLEKSKTVLKFRQLLEARTKQAKKVQISAPNLQQSWTSSVLMPINTSTSALLAFSRSNSIRHSHSMSVMPRSDDDSRINSSSSSSNDNYNRHASAMSMAVPLLPRLSSGADPRNYNWYNSVILSAAQTTPESEIESASGIQEEIDNDECSPLTETEVVITVSESNPNKKTPKSALRHI
eukprot:TRINITY_DN635_c0_g1_i1.p1 TRINITY_DN635_c0_g1~~TRINITY_DN635_c0_g1_i1.p1  ORF type:complete len:233 (+),score=38.37 TRINITY_DN635_c0_g1_i1:47-745(+)